MSLSEKKNSNYVILNSGVRSEYFSPRFDEQKENKTVIRRITPVYNATPDKE